ncbi:MAG: hypothetical protein RL477_1700 [Pseudomonadota bacterium]|jgi:hypothetical protein
MPTLVLPTLVPLLGRTPLRGAIAALALAACLAAPAGAQQVASLSLPEQEAFAFRRLQSELMVAALSCNDPRHREAYNIFIYRFRAALGDNARVLKAYFKRAYGAGGPRKLDDFMTSLANDASLASMGDPRFCRNSLTRFEAVNRSDRNQTAGMIVEEAELVVEQ